VSVHEGRSECRFLEATIAEVQAALVRQAAMRAGLWAAAAVALAMAGLVAVDGATNFAAGMRPIVYGLAAAGAAIIITAAATMAARAQVLAPMCVARLIEEARPDLKNALITFVELRADPGSDPSMCAAVGRRAARILSEADLCDFVPAACVCRAAWAATGGVCLLGAMLWLTQGVLFGHGPAAAEASQMVGDVAGRAPGGGGAGSGANDRAPSVSSGSRTNEEKGTSPGENLATSESNPELALGATNTTGAGEAAARSLAAALKADSEKFERLAEALGEMPGGAARSASAGDTGQGPSASDTGQAPSVSSGSYSNGEKQSAADVRNPDLTVGARNASQQAPGASDTGRAPSGAGAGSSANGRAPSVSSGLRPNEEKRVSPGESPAAGANNPDLTVGARNASQQAPGMPPSAGNGGDSGSGAGQASSPPIPKRPQSDVFPEKTLDAMRKVRRLIDEADTRLRDGEVTDAFLGRMGMSNAEFRRFVAAWQRQLEKPSYEPDAGASGDTRKSPAAPAAGSIAPVSGSAPRVEFLPAGVGADARPVSGLAPAAAAIQGGAVQGADTSVSVRLRPAVSAYFEAVGRLAAEKADPKATPKDVPK